MKQDWWQQHFPQGRQTVTIADASEREVSIAYGTVGQGQPLLLLHGIGSWSYNWRCNIHPLSQHFQVICVDAKGYGFSQAPPLPETVGHQVVELARLIETLCHAPVCIAAESMGALTALATTQAYPELIERLVLINVPIFPTQLPSWSMQLLSFLPLDWVQWIDQQQLARSFEPLVQQMTRWVRQEVVTDPNQMTDEDIYWITYPYLQFPGTLTQFAADLQAAAAEIDRLHRNQPNLIHTIQQRLPHVTCPTLVLWAEGDQWFPVADGERLSACLPHARLQVIPCCGHLASSGNPAVVNAAIIDHCRRQE